MDRTTLVRAQGFQLPAGYRVHGAGDYIWPLNEVKVPNITSLRDGSLGIRSTRPVTRGVGGHRGEVNVNGDGESDLRWRNDASGHPRHGTVRP